MESQKRLINRETRDWNHGDVDRDKFHFVDSFRRIPVTIYPPNCSSQPVYKYSFVQLLISPSPRGENPRY